MPDDQQRRPEGPTPAVAEPVDLGDMDVEDLRRHAKQAVDWAADYLATVGSLPVQARVAPGELRARLPPAVAERGEPMDAILQDLDRVVVPGLTHWNHPRFFAYFAVTGSGPGIIAELVTAALNVNGMLWRTAPVATELEQVTLDWLRQLLGLPEGFWGVITEGASMSTLLVLAAARERVGLHVRELGLAGRPDVPPMRVYASTEAHSSVEKAAITLGLGLEGVRRIGTDASFRMDPHRLAEAVTEDRARGRLPLAVVATVGTTSTTSIDPVPAVADVCEAEGLWLHVDGAYGATAGIVPELRGVLDGVERADSLVVNPHKWLFTPLDCSALYVRDPSALKRAFSLVPDYLRSDEEQVDNYMDFGVQLGRRFRALKLWMVLRYFGREGLVARVREHVRLAGLAAAWFDRHAWFRREAPTLLSTVCFRAVVGPDEAGNDAVNAALLERVNRGGRAYLSSTVLRGRLVLRLAVGNLRTTEADVRDTLDLLDEEVTRLRQETMAGAAGRRGPGGGDERR